MMRERGRDERGGPVKFVSLQNAARRKADDGDFNDAASQSCGRRGHGDGIVPQHVGLKRSLLTLLDVSSV